MTILPSLSTIQLTPLLRISWLAATLPILLSFLPSFHKHLSLFASRGKTLHQNMRFTLPQSYFLHFYILALLITTSLLVPIWIYAYREMSPLGISYLDRFSLVTSRLFGGSSFSLKRGDEVWRCVFVLVLMEVQVVRRVYESLVVFDYSKKARMHVLGYFAGLFFYTAAPLSLASSCAQEALSYARGQIAEFIVKGRERMPDIEFSLWDVLKPLINLGWCQYFGFVIFVWGWIHQLHCHAILGSLREHKGADEYVIPHGDWFEYVSCPHYLAEIIIYGGILVASGGLDVTIWLLFSFVVANLVFAAAETHKWYRCKFESYPPSRRAIFPFIY